MKNMIIRVATGLLIVSYLALRIVLPVGDKSGGYDYEQPGTIVEATCTHVIYKTPDGNLWECYGNYGCNHVNDRVNIRFNDNGTPDLCDDIILEVQ